MENLGDKLFPGELTFNQVRKELEGSGYVVVDQKPDQDTVEIEGLVIKLPLTNMSGMKVILHKIGETWGYYARVREDELEGLIRSIYKSEKSSIK